MWTERTTQHSEPWLAVEAAEVIRSHAQNALGSTKVIDVIALLSSGQIEQSGPVIDEVYFVDLPEEHSAEDELEALVSHAKQIEWSGEAGSSERTILAILRVSRDGAFGFSPKSILILQESLVNLQFVITAQPYSDGSTGIRVFLLHQDGQWAPSAQFAIPVTDPRVVSAPPKSWSVQRFALVGALLLLTAGAITFWEVSRTRKPHPPLSNLAVSSLETSIKDSSSYVPAANGLKLPTKATGVEVDSMNVTPAGPTNPDYAPPQPITQVLPEPRKFISKSTIPPFEVMMEIRVEASGKVSSVRLLRPVVLEQEVFTARSIEAARQWLFQPARIATVPVACKHILVFRYTGASRSKR